MANVFEDFNNMMNEFKFGSGSFGRHMDDDDGEDFLTSKEIVKLKENPNLKEEDLPDSLKGPVDIEESVHFQRFTTKHEHKYTQKEMDEIIESCKTTLVHDYGEFDRYHISDEERARNDSLAELATKLGGLKRIYRKVDQWIYAMRIVIEAWELVEKKENVIHSTDEFFEMVHDGRIYHSGIIMPQLKGIDKYSMDVLIKYISNPDMNPEDLLTKDELKKRDPWYEDEDDEESEEEAMTRLLSPEEVQYIIDHSDNPETIKVHDVKRKFILNYDKNVKNKKFSKRDKIYTKSLHTVLKKIQSNPSNRNDGDLYSRSWLITNSMFTPEEEKKDFWDDLYYDGSWTNDDQLFLLDMAEREEMLKQKPEGETYMTYADKELQDFFRTMEENGLNTVELRRRMNMTEDSQKQDSIKRERKNNKKIESALIQRITKLNNDPKFKKLVAKAEKEINSNLETY